MRSWIQSGGNTGPRDFALSWVRNLKPGIPFRFNILCQVGHATLVIKFFKHIRVKGIQAQEDGSHYAYSFQKLPKNLFIRAKTVLICLEKKRMKPAHRANKTA